MPAGLPCPNPTCPHVFPPATVAGATSLTCPRCGKVFYFRAGPTPAAPPPQGYRPAPPPQPAPPPGYRPVPAPPPGAGWPAPYPSHGPAPAGIQPAQPVMPPRAAPVAAPVMAPAAMPVAPQVQPHPHANLFDLSSTGPAEGGRRRKYRNLGHLHMALVLVALGGVLGLGVFGMYQVYKSFKEAEGRPQGREHISPDFEYSYLWPDDTWLKDDSFKVAFKVNLFAMTRVGPNGWMALGAKDYKNRPRDAEVIDEGLQRLRDYFGPDSLEYNQSEVKLRDIPWQRIVFKAQDPKSNVRMMGECYAVAYKGFVYWLYVWGQEEEIGQLRKDFADMRDRFRLKTERPWQDYRPPPKTYAGDSGRFTVTDAEAMWEKQAAGDFDPLGDLALVARDPARTKEAPKGLAGFDAEFVVLKLKPEAGTKPAMVARAYVEDAEKKQFEKTMMDPIPDHDKAGPVGEIPGHITELHVTNSPERHRYLILAVVESGGTVYCLKGECDWARRGLWETDFRRVIGTFRIVK